MSEIEHVTTGVGSLPVVRGEDGEPSVLFRTAVESIGLDYSAALRRLKRSSWACVAMTATQVPGDQTRQMATVSIDTWIMFLATVDETRVSEELRPLVVEFQKESAKALRDFWLKGVAVNDSATVQQLEQAKLDLETALEIAGHEVLGAKEQLAEAYEKGVRAGRTSSSHEAHGFNPYAEGRTFSVPPKRRLQAISYDETTGEPTYHY